MTTTERPAVAAVQVSRTAGVTGWITEVEERTAFQIAQHNFVEWSRELGEFAKVASENLYDNENFTLLDVRQHSAALHQIIARGEFLAVQFISLKMPKETESYVLFIDNQLKRLNEILTDWHGNPALHDDTPESFKEAMKEYADGKTVDWEQDLFQVDAPGEEHLST